MTDPELHAAAAAAAIEAEITPWSCFEYSDVPGTNGNPGSTPNMYAVIGLERLAVALVDHNSAGTTDTTGWLLMVRGVGPTVNGARRILAGAARALDQRRLTVDGIPTTRLHLDTTTAERFDSGRYFGDAEYVYAHHS